MNRVMSSYTKPRLRSRSFCSRSTNMSQDQLRRPQESTHHEPIKYGDVFSVSGDLAAQPIKPQDAAMMQSAENLVLGKTQKGGPAAVMQSAATHNEQAGLVGHGDVSPIPADKGVSVTETDLPGRRVVTEYVGGQPVSQYAKAAPVAAGTVLEDNITIGEALEAAKLTAGDKPVHWSDTAAIQAAEARATGRSMAVPGGVAAAQSAAQANERVKEEDDKIKLSNVLQDALLKLPSDKAATRKDAEKVAAAEMRNDPAMVTRPGGVAASVAAAARLNQEKKGRERF